MKLLDSSTLTDQSIAASKLAHTYTATRSCMVMVRVFIDQLSANTGSRQVWLGLIRGGTGSEYRVHMITQSVSVVSTVTSIFSYYGPLPVANTDILKVYVVGVAGDTTTTDIITEIWEENYVLDTVWTSAKAAFVDASINNNSSKYMHGAVWINTVSGSVGSTSYVNGIMTNPSDSLPNAKTIADNIFLKKFWIQAGSTIALSADMIGYVLEGSSWTLSSASARNISGTLIRNCENLTGLYTSPTQECYVFDCQVGTSTWGEVDFHGCHFVGTITLNAALPFLFDRCVGIPTNSPTISFGATADARSAVIKDYGGSLTVTNMRAGNALYIDGSCQLTLDATCTGGSVYISGNIKLTNSGSGQTIVDTSRYDEDQNVTNVTGTVNALASQAKADVNTEADTALADYGALKPTTAGHTLDVTMNGTAGIDWGNIENMTNGAALTETYIAGMGSNILYATNLLFSDETNLENKIGPLATGSIAGDIAALPSAAENADAVWDEALSGHVTTGTVGKKLADLSSGGSGAVLETVTVTVSGLPRDGVEVWVTTDEAGSNVVANGVTDALGEVDFMLDAGTYYVWKQVAGVNFTNPQTLVVS